MIGNDRARQNERLATLIRELLHEAKPTRARTRPAPKRAIKRARFGESELPGDFAEGYVLVQKPQCQPAPRIVEQLLVRGVQALQDAL